METMPKHRYIVAIVALTAFAVGEMLPGKATAITAVVVGAAMLLASAILLLTSRSE
jgi:hypothetical protein